MIYKILVKDNAGNQLGEFEKYRNLKFGRRLNNYGTCTFDVPLNDPKIIGLIALRAYSVEIYRDDILLWAGEQAIRDGNLTNTGDNWITLHCFGWLEQLLTRYTGGSDRTFTGIDAGQIAWTLIDESQSITNGDIGITEGSIEATMARDRVYRNQNIAQAIIDLSNVINGFDFEIDPSKVFNVYAQQGVDRTATVILEYGVNMQSVKITEDFSKPVNKAIILGDSGDYTQALRVEREDAVSEGLYKIREGLENDMSVVETATLEEKGDSLLRKYGNPLIKLSMVLARKDVTIADFALGDTINLKMKSGLYDINDNYRVYEWAIDYGEDNTEVLTLVLAKFIE